MRSKIKFLLLLIFIGQQTYSQRAQLNPSLWREVTKSPSSTRMVSLLVQGDPSVVEQQTKLLEGYFKYSVDEISSISLPLDEVSQLQQIAGIKRIEGLYGSGRLLDDMTLLNANVNPVHDGVAPLSQAYNGNGVVMSFLDDGIDFNHPDFKNADGTTRIKFIWDQTAQSGGTVPQPFNYGQEWNDTVINSGTCPYYETWTENGHGSNVAGIGAGNGLAINNYEGVASGSDIISVVIGLDENFLNNVADATEYSFEKAAAMGKPCVINASLGTYFGSHDGYDLPAQLIASLISQQNGRSFVAAAGNAGNIPFHLGYETNPDSSFTWMYYTGFLGKIFYEWWIDKDDAQNFKFAFGADDPINWNALGHTKYINLVNDFNYVNGVDSLKDTLYYNATRIGIITLYAFQFDSTYACDVSIQPDFTSYYWRFITNGTGRFDLWSGTSVTGTSDMLYPPYIPDENTFPDIARYVSPDANETTVSSFTCSDKVLTVANYTNRDQYIDYYGQLQILTTPPGTLSFASSWGPTRDGRIKPEIAAPGDATLSSALLYLMPQFIASVSYKVALGGMHVRNGGTSMASPVVAGVAGLLLQKNPNAGWKEIKDAIELSARQDDYTGYNLPDNKWGYGKVDAFTAMITTVVYGCTDPFSINFNPFANVDDGSCQPIVFGCNDVNALNYNPAANMSDGSCVYETGIEENDSPQQFTCYPNPCKSFTTFFFSSEQSARNAQSITITDIQGKTIDVIKISSHQQYVTYTRKLSSGLYFCRLQGDDSYSSVLKLMVSE